MMKEREKRLDEVKVALCEKEQIMSTMKDPYDRIEWNPDRNSRAGLANREEKSQGRKRTDRGREKWKAYFYDMIALCTLAAVLATLFKLLLH